MPSGPRLFYGESLAAPGRTWSRGMRLYDPQQHHIHAARYTGTTRGLCRLCGSVPVAPGLSRPGAGTVATRRLTWPSSSLTPSAWHSPVLFGLAPSSTGGRRR